MTKHPFTATDPIKNYLSGVDLSFSIKNIDSSAIAAGSDIIEIISKDMYNAIVDSVTPPAEHATEFAEALKRLRYAQAPYTLYIHFPFLQARISNNGITTHNSNDEQAAPKYLKDDLKESLLKEYAVYLKELIDYLEEQVEIFTQWKESTQRTELNALLIKSYREFDKIYNTEADAAFFIRSRFIQQEIINEKLIPRVGAIVQSGESATPAATLTKLKRACVYYILHRCIVEWDYTFIPAPVKRAINNETKFNSGSEVKDAREKTAEKFKNIADDILLTIDLKADADTQETEEPTEDIVLNAYKPKETDKHLLML